MSKRRCSELKTEGERSVGKGRRWLLPMGCAWQQWPLPPSLGTHVPSQKKVIKCYFFSFFFLISSGTSFLLFLLYEFSEVLPGSGSLLAPSLKRGTNVLHPGWDQSSALRRLLPSHKMPARAQY